MNYLSHSSEVEGQKFNSLIEPLGSTPVKERKNRLERLLNRVQSEISSATGPAGVQLAVDQLFKCLRILRREASQDEWKNLIDYGREHSLRRIVHEDPFTRRAFDKPRGYAGDAVMMDFIYGRQEDWTRPDASATGQAIFDYTTAAPASEGVRERRCHIADTLDRMAEDAKGKEVLAIACGHLREANLSSAVRRGRFSRFLALDSDPESLDEVESRYGKFGIQPVQANIRRLLTGRTDLGSFDLIYSTGLYDYLNESLARRLTTSLFRNVRPGGKLVIANFLPEIRDVGYMEMYMDWHLVYRDRSEMLAIADPILESEVREIRLRSEDNQNIVFLEITKRR
ncbi:MAG: class I SAM-dependent methyltransferase [Planctomycetota bacterium]